MNQNNPHTLKAFDDELDRIRGTISEMGSRVETMLEDAMTALRENDVDLAKRTAQADKLVDDLESQVEATVVQTIALRAPMADDLRELIASLKMSAVIERIGDYAKNVAKRVKRIEHRSLIVDNEPLFRMGEIAGEMIRMAMEAYAKRDVDLAQATCARDEEVDQIFRDLFVDFVASVAKYPEAAQDFAHMVVISKNIERIGDHAETCAEMVYYAQTGDRLGIESEQ